MPVEPLGYRRNRFNRLGMLLKRKSSVTRIQDKAGKGASG